MKKYIAIFFISMLPIIELRGAIPVATTPNFLGGELPYWPSLVVCVIGNMVPVPFIYFFARRLLTWGADKPVIGRLFSFMLHKGEKGGEKLMNTAGRGLFIALMLFVGIPLPGTGAWTGTLAASILNMKFKESVAAVICGVIIAGFIMGAASLGLLNAFRFLTG